MPDQRAEVSIHKYLLDILLSIRYIEQFVSTTPDMESFAADALVQSGVERKLEIIGEAMNKALRLDETLAITEARKIVNFRNFIIHSYDDVNYPYVWQIVQQKLPLLKQEVLALLPTTDV